VRASRFPEAPITASTTAITTTITNTRQLVMVRGHVVFVVQHSTVGTYSRTRLEIEFHVSCRNFSRYCAILCTYEYMHVNCPFTHAIQALLYCMYIKTVKSVIKKAAFSSQNSDSASPDERLTNWMRHYIAYIWIRIGPCAVYDP